MKLVRIENGAFENGFSLSSISIPSSVKLLAEGCFSDCTSLATVSYEAGSKLLSTVC
jgi:hypothetical protein